MNRQQASILYFAYGSNMWAPQVQMKFPDAYPVSIGCLQDYAFFINTDGFASIRESKGDYVYGKLWAISEKDKSILDKVEGIDKDHYTHCDLQITTATTGKVEALSYIANNKQPGNEPRIGYLERIIAAAEEAHLPASYVAFLKSFFSEPDCPIS